MLALFALSKPDDARQQNRKGKQESSNRRNFVFSCASGIGVRELPALENAEYANTKYANAEYTNAE